MCRPKSRRHRMLKVRPPTARRGPCSGTRETEEFGAFRFSQTGRFGRRCDRPVPREEEHHEATASARLGSEAKGDLRDTRVERRRKHRRGRSLRVSRRTWVVNASRPHVPQRLQSDATQRSQDPIHGPGTRIDKIPTLRDKKCPSLVAVPYKHDELEFVRCELRHESCGLIHPVQTPPKHSGKGTSNMAASGIHGADGQTNDAMSMNVARTDRASRKNRWARLRRSPGNQARCKRRPCTRTDFTASGAAVATSRMPPRRCARSRSARWQQIAHRAIHARDCARRSPCRSCRLSFADMSGT